MVSRLKACAQFEKFLEVHIIPRSIVFIRFFFLIRNPIHCIDIPLIKIRYSEQCFWGAVSF